MDSPPRSKSAAPRGPLSWWTLPPNRRRERPLSSNPRAADTVTVNGTVTHPVQSDITGTVLDDGTIPDRRGSITVDDEGTPSGKNVLIEDGKLVAVDFLGRVRLRDTDGDKLKGKERDSEGMHVINGRNGIRGDSELLIAFEQEPRIDRFSIEGRQVGEVELPKALTNVKHYRGANHALEAVTWHPDYGVMTLPQRPQDDGHFLYTASKYYFTCAASNFKIGCPESCST